MKEENRELSFNNRLDKISNKDLKELIQEVKKIREELGENPEISNIEYDIKEKDFKIKLALMKKIIRNIFVLEYVSIASVQALVNINEDIGKVTSAMSLLICLYMLYDMFKGNTKQLDDFKKSIMNRLELLKLQEYKKGLNQYMHCEEIINNNTMNIGEEKKYVKRR